MIFPEGRAAEGLGVRGQPSRGLEDKREDGLGTFNSTDVDHGWIYLNHGHGFVDPLTGIVLWLGVGVVGLGIITSPSRGPGRRTHARRVPRPVAVVRLRGEQGAQLHAPARDPSVRRLSSSSRPALARQPLAIGPIRAAARSTRVRRSSRRLERSVGWDFIQQGRRQGDPIGSTGRYARAHENVPGRSTSSPRAT